MHIIEEYREMSNVVLGIELNMKKELTIVVGEGQTVGEIAMRAQQAWPDAIVDIFVKISDWQDMRWVGSTEC